MNRKRICRLLMATILAFIALYSQNTIRAQDLPNYLNVQAPAQWSSDTLLAPAANANAQWWKALGDGVLDSLIERGINNNRNLLAAVNRIEQAKANYRIAQASYFPSFALGGSWSKIRQSGQMYQDALSDGTNSSYFTTAITSSWEIDLFGSIRKNAQSQKELYIASQDNYNALVLSLSSQIAIAYAQLRTAQQSLMVAEQNLASQKSIMDITEGRFKSGLATSLDVAQARMTYYTTEASLPSIAASTSSAINTLALLLGEVPSAVRAKLSVPGPIPNYYHLAAIGSPNEMIASRPDILAAARTVASYEAALQVSRKLWLPKATINSSAGYSAHDFDMIGNHKSLTYQFVPSLSWTIFNGGERTETIKASKALYNESINQYNETVLTAVQEVESAIDQYANLLKEVKALKSVVNQAKVELRLSLEQYKDGLANFQNVQTAQVSLLSSQSQLIASEGNALQALIQLYQASGAGIK